MLRRIKKTIKVLFFPLAVLFIATSFTGAYFSDSISVTNNKFETGSWGEEEPPPEPEPERVIISEYMADPSVVSDSNGEWFELFNPTSNQINLNGWKYCDDDCSESKIIDSDVIINPNSYIVLARKTDILVNGGLVVQYQISNMVLANSSDTISIYKPDGAGGFVLADSINYTSGWPLGAGKSTMLTDLSIENSIPGSWSLSNSAYGLGDKGTPGGPNL